eukprot:comp23211_c1_seq6/m.37771 comp23211_c1_seq6/g.37771  ORF comp23211_c1_seq6/g.37771 comp23211_c1_seq6/m.37771 type:complete len:973 (-) comp23211_c1_seq6:412-3330(-)
MKVFLTHCIQGVWVDKKDGTEMSPTVATSLPLFDFITWVFEACEMPETHKRGRAKAYQLLCKIIVKRHAQPIDFPVLSQFYRLLHIGLTHPDPNVVNEIILNSTSLFSLLYPGSSVLILDFVHAIAKLLDQPDNKNNELRRSAITLLCSLMFFPSLYNDLTVPTLDTMDLSSNRNMLNVSKDQSQADAGDKESAKKKIPWVAFYDIKAKIHDILKRAAMNDQQHPSNQCLALAALGVMGFGDAVRTNKIGEITNACIETLLRQVRSPDDTVATIAIDVLTVFSLQYPDLLKNAETATTDERTQLILLVDEILNHLADSITDLMEKTPKSKSDATQREKRVLELLFCLLEWLMATPPELLDHTAVGRKVFAVLRQAICAPRADAPDAPMEPGSPQAGRMGDTTEGSMGAVGKRKRPENYNTMDMMPEEGDVSNLVGTDNISKAATSVLFHVINNYCNFPSHAGVSRMTSKISENDEIIDGEELGSAILNVPGVQFFVYNDSTLISLVEFPPNHPSGIQARVLLRDMTGKHAWDSKILYQDDYSRPLVTDVHLIPPQEDAHKELSLVPLVRTTASDETKLERKRSGQPPVVTVGGVRKWTQVPCWDNMDNSSNRDMLDQLLVYIGDTSPELPEYIGDVLQDQHYNDMILNVPAPTPKNQAETETLAMATLQQQDDNETAYLAHCKTDPTPNQQAEMVLPSQTPIPESAFHYCRIILTHLGYLSWENRRHFHLLSKNEGLLRRLKNLDKAGSREYHKIGIVYVGPGQADESSILGNKGGSQLYEDFLAAMGWEVDLTTHSGFLGLLDPENNGRTTVYFATSTMEVVYHVATRMPYEDDKHLKKKRHIGNDRVQIVWTEHWKDFRPDIIRTKFKDAIIIICPLTNGLYKINIIRGPEVPMYGPLFDGMIVSKDILAPLVRATAINAGRAVMSMEQGFERHYQQRMTYVDEIVSKHKTSTTFEDFMEQLVRPSGAGD